MNQNTMFKYGQVLRVAPTMGVDCDPGEIVITGIMYPSSLPGYIDKQSWEFGEADLDFELNTQPWYFFQYTREDLEGDTYDLPQFALEEVTDKAALIISKGAK